MMTFNTAQPDMAGSLFADCFGLTQRPVCYVYKTDLAFCSREPCRSFAAQLSVGQHAELHYESSARRIAIEAVPGCPAGYLYAQDAAFLSILYDCFTRYFIGIKQAALLDNSTVCALVNGPDPLRPETRRMRYPKVGLNISLTLRYAWPLFTILTILHLKDETVPGCADLAANPWLRPFADLRQSYCQKPYDTFRLPELLSRAWLFLTDRSAASIMATTQ